MADKKRLLIVLAGIAAVAVPVCLLVGAMLGYQQDAPGRFVVRQLSWIAALGVWLVITPLVIWKSRGVWPDLSRNARLLVAASVLVGPAMFIVASIPAPTFDLRVNNESSRNLDRVVVRGPDLRVSFGVLGSGHSGTVSMVKGKPPDAVAVSWVDQTGSPHEAEVKVEFRGGATRNSKNGMLTITFNEVGTLSGSFWIMPELNF